jgi:rhodanese-related sulfurtransferase
METITRDELKKGMDQNGDFTLVDVLPEKSYRKFHLPGAINVPVGEGFDEAIQEAVPDKSRPVVVYCKDSDCPASPKAARRMEDLGYEKVYDYEAGKEDWKAAGLPVESPTESSES